MDWTTTEGGRAVIEACADGTLVVFAGGGVAARAGGYRQEELLARTIEALHARSGDESWSLLSDRALGGARTSDLADLVAARADPGHLSDAVDAALRNLIRPGRRSLLDAIASLDASGFITTNWDDLLRDAIGSIHPIREMGPRDVELLLGSAWGGSSSSSSTMGRRRDAQADRPGHDPLLSIGPDPFFLRALGRPHDDLIFTADLLAQRIARDQLLARFLSSVLATRTVLFLGTSRSTIERICRAAGVRASRRQAHCAVTYEPVSPDDQIQQLRFRELFGIDLLYEDELDTGLEEFIRTIVERARRHGRAGSSERQQLPPTVERVWLEHVGGFESLELDFHPGWNVLLGDNGTGKSTILKALAVALAGTEGSASPRAGRLLRWGAPEGRIEVTLAGDRFESRLVRRRSTARIEHGTVTPVEAGSVVALGFPAQRGSSSDLEGPDEWSHRQGSVSGLQPLIDDAVDRRFDDLRQWLVNTEFRNLSELQSTDARGAFFEVLDRLVPHSTIEYSRIDQEAWDVLVLVDGVEVPLSQVSQGLASVTSWVGALVDRLSTAASEDGGDWRTCPAIVLIDEIDAHLHPQWQRLLVPALKDVFPAVQFIVTTHSPLIAADLSPGELRVLSRDGSGTSHSVASLRGLSIDEILTSTAFGLSTSRDATSESRIARIVELRRRTDLNTAERAELDALSSALRSERPSPIGGARSATPRRQGSNEDDPFANLSREEQVAVIDALAGLEPR